MDVSSAAQPAGGLVNDDDLAYWLALLRCPGIGPRRYQVLLEYYQAPRAVFELKAAEIGRLDLPAKTRAGLQNPDWKGVEADLNWRAASASHHLLSWNDPLYPELLRQIDSAPPVLFVKGNPELLSSRQLGMVGSRNPSAGGQENAFQFAQHLSRAGFTVTSGMAMGVDACAHRGALAGGGLTVAVTGTGLDRIYPARNKKLAHEIAAVGAIVSEFPIGTPPLPDHFPRRNRIISGLSLGVLVVEAAPQSGSLITARLASEQGREVFAIPGSIHNPLARGCHQLIRQGAKLAETIEDILDELGGQMNLFLPARSHHDPEPAQDEEACRLLSVMGFDPLGIDALIARSGLTADRVCSILLVLELQGMVSSAPGGLYIKAR